jgi:hypothetical protein
VAVVELPVIFFYEIRNLSAITTLLFIIFTVFCPVLRILPLSEFVWIDFSVLMKANTNYFFKNKIAYQINCVKS